MILGFSTQLNNKPTYFVEKIQRALTDTDFFDTPELVPYEFNFEFFKECRPKLHTIREDKTDRWKTGTKIDFFINVRTKKMFRFAPVLPVVSTQKIEIAYNSKGYPIVTIDDKCFYVPGISLETKYKMLHLAQNDGFDTIEEFFEYFNTDFKGKIVHWTDKRY